MITSNCIPSTDIYIALEVSIKFQKDEIFNLIKLFVSKTADGFHTQKGSIFDFRTHAEDEPEYVFKISSAIQNVEDKLEKALVYNLAEERSVGSFNNEIKMRGKRNIESASRKLVLNKPFDLVEKEEAANYLKYKKPSQDVSALKDQWREIMKMVEDEAFCNKEKINEHLD